MSPAPSAQLIPIWLTPDGESLLTLREIASYLGISYHTLYDRVVTHGDDCDLTYFPGNIPQQYCKRSGPKKARKKKEQRAAFTPGKDIDPVMARLFVLRLICKSRSEYLKRRCPSCRSFLLNEDLMLYWYLELMYDEDLIALYIKRQKIFVQEVDSGIRTRRKKPNPPHDV